jgi:tRNA nucleotidyltransferase (CCA-adding enzyme)
MISHGFDASAVRAWVAGDPVLSRLAVPSGAPEVSLVGGAVRDALLGVQHGVDVDLVVEGDAIVLARLIGRDLGARLVAHERFGTARLEFAHGRHIDIVGARRERYPSPGALPVVTPGTLADDLARRDFTVNAMAYRLSGASAGEIVDPQGGRADLAAGCIRLIRDGAFEEDPSRVIRAVRYAARLGFTLDAGTERQARECMAQLDLGASRVGDELRRLLDEESCAVALDVSVALGAEWPDPDPGRSARLASIAPALGRAGAPQPAAWALRLGLALTPGLVDGVAAPQWARAVATEVRDGFALAGRLSGVDRPSQVDALLRDRPDAEQVGAVIAGAEQVAVWWSTWRDCTPDVDGSDLVAAGVRPGPAIGRALAVVRAAVLDGEAGDREAQLALARAACDTS